MENVQKYLNKDVEEYAAATWTFSYLLVLLYLLDGRLKSDRKVRVSSFEETIDRLELYYDRWISLRGKLGLSTDSRAFAAFTDSFRFDGFSFVHGVFHGNMEKAEEICGKWSAIHWEKAPDDGMALNFEISALCMMWAHGAEKVLNALYSLENPHDNADLSKEGTQVPAMEKVAVKPHLPMNAGFGRFCQWLCGRWKKEETNGDVTEDLEKSGRKKRRDKRLQKREAKRKAKEICAKIIERGLEETENGLIAYDYEEISRFTSIPQSEIERLHQKIKQELGTREEVCDLDDMVENGIVTGFDMALYGDFVCQSCPHFLHRGEEECTGCSFSDEPEDEEISA